MVHKYLKSSRDLGFKGAKRLEPIEVGGKMFYPDLVQLVHKGKDGQETLRVYYHHNPEFVGEK